MVLAFLAAVALAKYRFTRPQVFITFVIGIQMLPAGRARSSRSSSCSRSYHLTGNYASSA